MTGVQTLVPIMLDHVNAGRLTLERFVDHDERRARSGSSASRERAASRSATTPISPWSTSSAARRSRNDWIASKCGWTPYDGVTVTGWPIGTIVRGNVVMWDGTLETPSRGEVVRFEETLGKGE